MGPWFAEVLCFAPNLRWPGDKAKKTSRALMGICDDKNDIDFHFYTIIISRLQLVEFCVNH